MDSILSLDVGGTVIKYAVIDTTGNLRTPIYSVLAKSQGTKEEILNIFDTIITNIKVSPFSFSKIGIGFPGPFDYDKGICLIENLHKYKALYNFNIKKYLKNKHSLSVKFLNDAHLYALGASSLGPGKNFKRLLCISLGTGCGAGFVVDKKIVVSGKNIPKDGYIFHLPFENSIIDHYISATGIRNMLLASSLSTKIHDVKELAIIAKQGDPIALSIFDIFSKQCAKAIFPIAKNFNADCIVIGGQIAKSAELFVQALQDICTEHAISVQITSKSTDLAIQAAHMMW